MAALAALCNMAGHIYFHTTNTSATYTTRPSCSFLHWLLTFSTYHNLAFWASVCKMFALCYQTVVCLFCLCCPVCNVGVLWPNGLMDQDETWHAGRPRPWPHCFRWGPSSPSPKGNSALILGPYLLWPNGWMDYDAIWYGCRRRPRRRCVRWEPATPPKKRAAPPPQLSAHVHCGETAG